MGFEFYQEYEFVQPEYRAVVHELRDPEGQQRHAHRRAPVQAERDEAYDP